VANIHIVNKMTKKQYILTGIGVVVCLISGYAYYHYVGCASGTCAITSKPLNSTLYGGLMGGLLFNMFVTSPKKKDK
jgi:C4-dicarboxylate transporter